MAKSEITFEYRTTWAFLAMRLFTWLKIIRLLRMLDNVIIARVYCNGEFSREIRFHFNKHERKT